MKNLLKVALISSLAINLFAYEDPEELINECAKGNTEACSKIIDNDPELAEIKNKLLEDEWTEEERLGIALRIHYVAYQRAKDSENKAMSQKMGKKFVKQAIRTEMYKK
jgi:hypothetical protein